MLRHVDEFASLLASLQELKHTGIPTIKQEGLLLVAVSQIEVLVDSSIPIWPPQANQQDPDVKEERSFLFCQNCAYAKTQRPLECAPAIKRQRRLSDPWTTDIWNDEQTLEARSVHLELAAF